MTDELRQHLERIVEMGRQRTVVCSHLPSAPILKFVTFVDISRCPDCHGTQECTDPAMKGLVEVVTIPCLGIRHDEEFANIPGRDELIAGCPTCHGSARVLRTWNVKETPGALAGALAQWAAVNWIALPNLSYLLCQLFGEPDCDLRAASLVLDFLEKWKGH